MASRSGSAGASRASSSTKRPPSGKTKTKNLAQDYLSKEEEYKRLNAELEERTTTLLKEAEEVFQDQEEFLSKPTVSAVNLQDEPGLEEDEEDGDFMASFASTASRASTSNSSNVQTKATGSQATGNRPVSRTKKLTNSRPVSRNKNTTSSAADKTTKVTGHDINLDLFDDRVSLANTISALEDEVKDGTYTTTLHDNVLPQGAEEMGSEATIRFLKAKLRVMQEEMDLLSAECSKKNGQIEASESKVKELTEEQSRIQKTNQSLQIQIDKYKKIIDESKKKTEALETQVSALKKDLDSLQREQKQATTNKNAVEVRLNRALEEVEKYKAALQKSKTASKDSNDQERKRVEQLMAENKRLEKQKAELMSGFKKQMKLIDILKRQKMHIEAAKLLSFTEEEFVKALDWGN